jgi:hypothetical protein
MFPVAAPIQPNREAPQPNQPSNSAAIRTDYFDNPWNGPDYRFILPAEFDDNPIPYSDERGSDYTAYTQLADSDDELNIDDDDGEDPYLDLRLLNGAENLFYQEYSRETVEPDVEETNRTRFKCKDGEYFYVYHNLPHYLAVHCPEHVLASFPNRYPWNGEQDNQIQRSHIDLLPDHYNPDWFDKRSPHLWLDGFGWVVDYRDDPAVNTELIVRHYDEDNNFIEQIPETNLIQFDPNDQRFSFYPNKRTRND